MKKSKVQERNSELNWTAVKQHGSLLPFRWPPEEIFIGPAPTQAEGLVQRPGHLFVGFIVRAQVLHTGEQLRESLPQHQAACGGLGRVAG